MEAESTAPDRTWETVCGDCARYRAGRCAAHDRPAAAGDCIAAICRDFESARRERPGGREEEGLSRDHCDAGP